MSKSVAAETLAVFIAQRVVDLDLDDRELEDYLLAGFIEEASRSSAEDLRRAARSRPAHRTLRTAYRRLAGLI